MPTVNKIRASVWSAASLLPLFHLAARRYRLPLLRFSSVTSLLSAASGWEPASRFIADSIPPHDQRFRFPHSTPNYQLLRHSLTRFSHRSPQLAVAFSSASVSISSVDLSTRFVLTADLDRGRPKAQAVSRCICLVTQFGVFRVIVPSDTWPELVCGRYHYLPIAP